MALSGQLSRLGKQSAIYGLGGLVSRILAVLLLPLYTRYLSKGDYGEIETLIALVTVLTIILRFGISSAFFRFYFDAEDHDGRRLVLRTSFWFTMTMATLGLVLVVALAAPISDWLFGDPGSANLVRASAVALWANMNYEQMTSLFRVEERPVAFVIASLTNVVLTIGGTVLLVVVLEKGPLGVIVGNFIGTLIVYLALLGYRREQLGLQMDRGLLRRMNHFGLPLVPSALFLWTTNFSDRFFLVKLTDTSEVGLYSVGVRVASAMVLVLTAFRTAWPAFAFSIKSDEEAKRTYAWVLTYLVVLSTWVATGLALLSPWLVDWLTDPEFSSASRVVGPLAFAAVSFAGFIVVSIGIGRSKRTQFNWVITGVAAVINVTLNLALIPIYGMMGAAIATVAAYTVMFAGMAWWAQRIFPCPYQWRRVLTAAAVGVALATVGKVVGAGLPLCLGLIVLYPVVLLPVGFYLPAERKKLRSFVARA
jgi:O-antigen/teichoic acid export membrane protein